MIIRRYKKKEPAKADSCGTTRNRTRDSRIFSPLLYQLSYGTSVFGWTNVKQK